MKYTYQLFDQGQPISAEKAKAEYGLNIMHFNMLLAAIPPSLRALSKNFDGKVPSTYEEWINNKNLAHDFYRLLTTSDHSFLEKKAAEWSKNGSPWTLLFFEGIS